MKRLQGIQDSEINFQISCFWDNVWTAKLGDELNGFIDEGSFGSLENAILWLGDACVAHYPDSEYVKSLTPTQRANSEYRNVAKWVG